MDRQRILVTGSKGLIGNALSNYLKKNSVDVIEVDSRAHPSSLGYGDVRDLSSLREQVDKCQGIIHLAAVSRVIWGEQNPPLCWDVNVGGTKQVLEMAYRSPCRPWVIFASSREVYGQQTVLPVTEESARLNPLNTYARSKVAAEKLVMKYQQRGLSTAILRFSNVYGSVDDYDDRVIPAFCCSAVNGMALRLDGVDNLFDFTHVSDVIAGIVATMDKLQSGVQSLPPMHLTSGHGTSLLQVIKIIERILDIRIKYQQAPARSYDVRHFYGNPAQAQALLGWKAQVSLSQGIQDLLMQYQQYASSVAIA